MRFCLLFVFLLFFISCMVYTPGKYFIGPSASLSPIPLKPHTNDVEVFLNGEKPVRSFYRIKMVEVQGDPFTTADQMLIRLKSQAQKEGIDALLVNDIGKQANTTTTLPSGDGVIAYQKLVGLGIKYKDRIDYIEQILKEQVVQLWPDENPEPKQFSISFNLKGELLPLKDEFTSNFFQYELFAFEDENSIYLPLPNWDYKPDNDNLLFSKRLKVNDAVVIRSQFQMAGSGMLKSTVKRKMPGSDRFEVYELERYYKGNPGLLSERKLKKRKGGSLIWEDEILYRYNGLPSKIKRYHYKNGQKQLYFEIENRYHSIDDLPATDN